MNPAPSPNARSEADFAEARELQWAWKPDAMGLMAVAVCRLALVRGVGGEFSAKDLKLDYHGGSGIAGAVFHRLAKDEVIAPVGGWCEADFVQKYVKNAGGNRVGVWRLKSHARAQAVLRVHEDPVGEHQNLRQAELLPAA